MANELKFGNKVVFLNGNPILLPKSSSDPGSPVSGDMYYNSSTNRVKYYDGSVWQNVAYGDVVSDHGALSGLGDDDHTQYALLAGRAGGQTVIGGTAASNNLILQSTSDSSKGQVWVDEATASTSSTTGAFRVSGGAGIGGSLYSGASLVAATSVLSPLVDRASSGTLAIGGANSTQIDVGTHANTATANFVTGSGNKSINIGTGAGTNTINIGGSSSTVNIIGTLNYVQSTNLQVSDKLITVNKGGATNSADGAGIEIEENSAITGYLQVGNSRASWDFKAPVAGANARLARITPPGQDFIGELAFATLSADRTYTFPDASGTVALTSDLSGYLALSGGSLTGALQMNAQNELRLADGDSSNYVALRGAATIGSNYTITLPAAAPASDTFLKYNGSAYVWASAGTGSVTSGVAGRLSLYPTSSDNVDDVYVQNSQDISVAIAAQGSRSAALVYTIPNPGDAITAADFILSEGAQTVNGAKTFGSSIGSTSNNSIDLGSDAAEFKDLWAHALKHNDSTNPDLAISTTGNNGSIVMTAHGTGNLDIKATKMRRSESGSSSNFMEDQYIDGMTLAANTSSPTEISSSLSFALASFDGAVINYRIKEATSNKARIGQLIVSTDGTVASSSDQFSETAALGAAAGLQLDATISGGNVVIRYNNTHASNACTMRAQIRRFRA